MSQAKRLANRNIGRARHSLPYLPVEAQELIAIIPCLLALGDAPCGVYGHPVCTPSQFDLLMRHLGCKPDLPVGRLPDRICLESLMAIPRPSLTGPFSLGLTLIAIPRPDIHLAEVHRQMEQVGSFLRHRGITTTTLVQTQFPEFLINEIMRLGIVLGGKHPVTSREELTAEAIHIGELPSALNDPTLVLHADRNPFQDYLNRELAARVSRSAYPCPLSIPGANPFILPYLNMLTESEERADHDRLTKMRTSLFHLFGGFGPTRGVETVRGTSVPDRTSLAHLSAGERLRLRKWLVPLEDDELPLFSWPPLSSGALDEVSLTCRSGLWSLQEAGDFAHRYSWMVLAWGALAGLIGIETRIRHAASHNLKPQATQYLMDMLAALEDGATLIVTPDPLQGSIRVSSGRFFTSNKPFALLENGIKFSLELHEPVKKKALIDDRDLEITARTKI